MRSLILFSASIFFTACDIENPPCDNQNPIFEKNAPGSVAYNNELAKVLKEQKDDATFYHAGYDEKEGREYMKVEAHAKAVCAMVWMDISGNEDMANYRRVKGQSYAHSRIFGLDYTIVPNDSTYGFTFVDMTWLVD